MVCLPSPPRWYLTHTASAGRLDSASTSLTCIPVPSDLSSRSDVPANTHGKMKKSFTILWKRSFITSPFRTTCHDVYLFLNSSEHSQPAPTLLRCRRPILLRYTICKSFYLPAGRLSKPFSARIANTSSMCRQSHMQAPRLTG